MTTFDGAQRLIDDLQFLHRNMNAFQKLLREGEEQAPGPVDASDSSGQVRVFLDASGTASSIRVSAGWKQRLAPEALAQAVTEASRQAVSERVALWGENLERTDWKGKVDRIGQRIERGLGGEEAGAPPAFQRMRGQSEPRPVNVLAEEMLKLFDRTQNFTAPSAPAEFTGRDRSRRVSLSVAPGAGITGCDIDARWAGGQNATDLTSALKGALEAALAEAAARPAPPSPAEGVDGLLAETLTLLDRLPNTFR